MLRRGHGAGITSTQTVLERTQRCRFIDHEMLDARHLREVVHVRRADRLTEHRMMCPAGIDPCGGSGLEIAVAGWLLKGV